MLFIDYLPKDDGIAALGLNVDFANGVLYSEANWLFRTGYGTSSDSG